SSDDPEVDIEGDIPSNLIAIELNTSCPNIPSHPPPAYHIPALRPLVESFAQAFRKDKTLTLGLKLAPFVYRKQQEDILDLISEFTDEDGTNPIAFLSCTNTLGGCTLFTDQTGKVNGPTQDHRRTGFNDGNVSVATALPTKFGGLAGDPLHYLSLGAHRRSPRSRHRTNRYYWYRRGDQSCCIPTDETSRGLCCCMCDGTGTPRVTHSFRSRLGVIASCTTDELEAIYHLRASSLSNTLRSSLMRIVVLLGKESLGIASTTPAVNAAQLKELMSLEIEIYLMIAGSFSIIMTFEASVFFDPSALYGKLTFIVVRDTLFNGICDSSENGFPHGISDGRERREEACLPLGGS
ncbi:10963_t:CDS:2, partial [Acaulospora colombiana]